MMVNEGRGATGTPPERGTAPFGPFNDTNINVSINYDKFNQLIKELNESIVINKHIVKRVEGERNTITYLIQKMNHDLTKLKIKRDSVNDDKIEYELLRLNERMNGLEFLVNSRLTKIDNSIHELMKIVLQKL